MNPHALPSVSPTAILRTVSRNRYLIWSLTKREVLSRYNGSVAGAVWSFLNPVLLLILYTYVFSVVFKLRWSADSPESKFDYGLLLFVGMVMHSLLADVLVKSPTLILSNSNYVKKVVFPLEILSIVLGLASLFQAAMNSMVLMCGVLIFGKSVQASILLLPIVIFPLSLIAVGLSWLLASLGVFLRDINQPIGLAITVLLFASPIFYPVSALPAKYQDWLVMNPLTFPIEQSRSLIFHGGPIQWDLLAMYYLLAALVAYIGFCWFQKTRKGFADVL